MTVLPFDALFLGPLFDDFHVIGVFGHETGLFDAFFHAFEQLHVIVGDDDVSCFQLVCSPLLVVFAPEALSLRQADNVAGAEQVSVERRTELHGVGGLVVVVETVICPVGRVFQELFQLALVD